MMCVYSCVALQRVLPVPAALLRHIDRGRQTLCSLAMVLAIMAMGEWDLTLRELEREKSAYSTVSGVSCYVPALSPIVS